MSLTPGRVNFVCPQGSTFRKTVTYKIDDVPVNITGYTSRLQVRETHYSTDTITSLTSGNGITLATAPRIKPGYTSQCVNLLLYGICSVSKSSIVIAK